MKVTLLISTYNWPEALNLVLKSLVTQTVLPHEVLIADDGSSEATRSLIDQYKEILPVPLEHIWHEDKGFRKTVILNKALAVAKGDYIIQLDGDCIMHEKFIEDHLDFSRQNNFLYGSRVNIKKEVLPEIYAKEKIRFSFFDSGIRKRTRNLHLPILSKLYKNTTEYSGKLRGCNFSFWRKDFLEVNGYDENILGWGKEDSELVIRFLNKGLEGRRLRYRAIIYHIWHKENPRENLQLNVDIQHRSIAEKVIRCENGVDKYL